MGSYDYAGCMSLPRLIYLRGDRLIQEPVPEVAALRLGSPWQADNLTIFPEESLPLEGITGPAVEIQASFARSDLYSESRLYTFSHYCYPSEAMNKLGCLHHRIDIEALCAKASL